MSLVLSIRDQRVIPRLAPVAFVNLTIPRAAKGGKARAIEGKGKGKTEDGQDTYGEGRSGGKGGGRGEGRCRHGKQRGKGRECQGRS
jgi:hypothetical protein